MFSKLITLLLQWNVTEGSYYGLLLGSDLERCYLLTIYHPKAIENRNTYLIISLS